MDRQPAVIQTQGLTKLYKTVAALKALDLTVYQNSICGFLGPNGAGKTTTIKLLLGLAFPTSGGGTIFGKDIHRESVAIRERVGYLSQSPRFYEHLTARQTLEFTAHFFFKGPAKLIDERVSEMLVLVGLEDKADRPIKSFSGGERQRLGIAQAQVNYPDLLILDEPAASLDPLGRRDVLDVMERLRKHTTIFYSTHILDDVQRISDRVVILNHGELVASGPIEDLLTGSGAVVYDLGFRGDADQAKARLAGQPWLGDLKIHTHNDDCHWVVTVTDPAAAEQAMLRVLLEDPGLVITDFRRRSLNLEEVFMNLVGGEQDAR